MMLRSVVNILLSTMFTQYKILCEDEVITFTMGVMNSTRNDGTRSNVGQKEWIKLIKSPFIWEPS